MHNAAILWDLDDEDDGNVQHIAEHGVSVEEAEEVLLDDGNEVFTSRSSGYPIVFGYTSTGRYLAVVFEHVDEDPLTLRPITAYDAPERRRRR